jgi:hypothetical protein
MDDVHIRSTSRSAARKRKKKVRVDLPNGTQFDSMRIMESDINGLRHRRKGTKKIGRKAKDEKQSESVTNRKWQDSLATSFP